MSLEEYARLTKFSRHTGFSDIFYSEQFIELYGEKFNVEIVFINKKLESIKLDPVCDGLLPQNLDAGSPEIEKILRDTCDKWLFNQLGEAKIKTIHNNKYLFNWGKIISVSNLDLNRQEYEGGYIVISYKKESE